MCRWQVSINTCTNNIALINTVPVVVDPWVSVDSVRPIAATAVSMVAMAKPLAVKTAKEEKSTVV